MKKIRGFLIAGAVFLSLLQGIDAQTSTNTVVGVVAAEEGLPLVSPDDVPTSGTFWVTDIGNDGTVTVPWPCMPPSSDAPVYSLPNGGFLVDQSTNDASIMTPAAITNDATPILDLIDMEQEEAATAASGMTRGLGFHANDLPALPDPGTNYDEDTNDDSGYSYYVLPDYGTNLWIAQWAMTNNTVTGFASNTIADVQYEIQTNSDLTTTNWGGTGIFILGSETTNWTALPPILVNLTNNVFFRLQSWQDSNGSGIPDWWWLSNFGQDTNVDPYADPEGDGWDNLQKFELGMNPNEFYKPPAPQGLTAVYNTSNGTVTVSWPPSSGNVTGYTLEDSDGNTFALSASTTSFVDSDVSSDQPDLENNDNLDTTFQVQACYGTTNSAWSASVSAEANTLTGYIVPGATGNAYLTVSALPPNTTSIRLTVIDYLPDTPVIITNFDIPIGDFTNGVYPLPNNMVPSDGNYRLSDGYGWLGQAIGTNGEALTASTFLRGNYTGAQDNYESQWLVPPFFDGRAQLKQNLIFQLRAALATIPFQYTEYYTNENPAGVYFYGAPSEYAYAGWLSYYEFNNGPGWAYVPVIDSFQPFEENCFDENFVFNSTNLDSTGRSTTGVGGSLSGSVGGSYSDLSIKLPGDTTYPQLELPIEYAFVAPTQNDVTIPSVLATNDTQWLSAYPIDSLDFYLSEIGITNELTGSSYTFGMPVTTVNLFGLKFLSAKIGYTGPGVATLFAGSETTEDGYWYPETAQPEFSLIGYDSWIVPSVYFPGLTNGSDFPSFEGLSMTHTNPLLITSVGNASFQVFCYAQLQVTNSVYSGVYGFLQQYFDQAYELDTNGNATTNTTGILSPYGQFFATQPGPVALVTMPDVDTGQQGTDIVHCISLNVDKNHDGTMDLTFNGPDTTSQSSPMEFWINDGNDGTGVGKSINAPQMPDSATNVIRSMRELENFARLWVCGVPSGDALDGYQVSLSFQNCTGSPAIKLFPSADYSGSDSYLTSSNDAMTYVGNLMNYSNLGTVSSTNNYIFPYLRFYNGGTNCLLFEGVSTGSGELTLTIQDSNSNIIAQSGVWLDLHDVRDFFETAEITNSASGAISNYTSALESVQPAVSSGLGGDTIETRIIG